MNLVKEVKELTGLDLSSLNDPKVRTKLIKKSIPYVLFGYVGNLLSHAYRLSNAKDSIGKLMDTINSLSKIMANPLPSLHWKDLLFGIATGIGIKLVVYFKGKNAKNGKDGKCTAECSLVVSTNPDC